MVQFLHVSIWALSNHGKKITLPSIFFVFMACLQPKHGGLFIGATQRALLCHLF